MYCKFYWCALEALQSGQGNAFNTMSAALGQICPISKKVFTIHDILGISKHGVSDGTKSSMQFVTAAQRTLKSDFDMHRGSGSIFIGRLVMHCRSPCLIGPYIDR